MHSPPSTTAGSIPAANGDTPVTIHKIVFYISALLSIPFAQRALFKE